MEGKFAADCGANATAICCATHSNSRLSLAPSRSPRRILDKNQPTAASLDISWRCLQGYKVARSKNISSNEVMISLNLNNLPLVSVRRTLTTALTTPMRHESLRFPAKGRECKRFLSHPRELFKFPRKVQLRSVCIEMGLKQDNSRQYCKGIQLSNEICWS